MTNTPRDEMRVMIGQSTLGLVLVAEGSNGVIAVLLDDDRNVLQADLASRFPRATFVHAPVNARAAQVIGLVDRPSAHVEVPIEMRGTPFQIEVWKALRTIPPGTTASYTDIARRIGRPNAVRAVAAACAANHLAVIVPCHRVVRSDGQLSSYRWGVERKRMLLNRETETVFRLALSA